MDKITVVCENRDRKKRAHVLFTPSLHVQRLPHQLIRTLGKVKRKRKEKWYY